LYGFVYDCCARLELCVAAQECSALVRQSVGMQISLLSHRGSDTLKMEGSLPGRLRVCRATNQRLVFKRTVVGFRTYARIEINVGVVPVLIVSSVGRVYAVISLPFARSIRCDISVWGQYTL
jgi:hypothetical protein